MNIGSIGTALVHAHKGVRVFLYIMHAPRSCVIVPLQVECAKLTEDELPKVMQEIKNIVGPDSRIDTFRILLKSLSGRYAIEYWMVKQDCRGAHLERCCGPDEVRTRVRAVILSEQSRTEMFPDLDASPTTA